MTEKDVTIEELEDTVKETDEQLDLMEWKLDSIEREPLSAQDLCVINLIKSVSEVRGEYAALRRELGQVQALQRELAARLRAQLHLVHGKFHTLRQRIASVQPPQR